MHAHKGLLMLIYGIVIILAKLYTTWDIWVVIGVLIVIKGFLTLVHPSDCCKTAPAKKKK